MNNDLISREALKDEIRHQISKYNSGLDVFTTKRMFKLIDNAPTVNDCPNCEYKKNYDYICSSSSYKELQALREFKKENERPQGKWISAEDELPEEMQKVLIWFEYYRYGDFNCMFQTYGFGYVCDGRWSPFINGETGWQDYRIIAWQPLPEPYKKGGAE